MVDNRKSGIFAIKNIPNGKMYIGKSEDLRKAKSQYFIQLRRGDFPNKLLQEDFKLFNEDEFEFQCLEYCPPEELDSRKDFYINFYGTYTEEVGYNVFHLSRRVKNSSAYESSNAKKYTWPHKSTGRNIRQSFVKRGVR